MVNGLKVLYHLHGDEYSKRTLIYFIKNIQVLDIETIWQENSLPNLMEEFSNEFKSFLIDD